MASPNLALYNATDDTEITAINYGSGDAGEILPTSAGTEYHLWNDKGAVLESDAAVAIRVSARDSDGQEVEPITTQKWVEVKSTTIHAGTDGGSTTGYTDDDMSNFEPVGENAYVLIGNIPSDCYRKLFIRVNIPPSAEQSAVTFSIYITPQYLSQGIADYITDIHGDGVLPTGDMCEVTDNAAADSVIDIASGVALINDNAVLVYAQSKTLPTDAGTYKVYITLDGVISYTTTTIPTNSIELAEVVIAASVVSSVTDSRVFISNVRSTIADADKFLKSSGTGASFAELTEADISDLGTYLEDITAESILDLIDTPAAFDNGKFLKSTADGTVWDNPAGSGDVVGPTTNTDNAIARWNGADSKTLQDSLVTIDDNGSINIPSGQTYKINSSQISSGDLSDGADLLKNITGESFADLSDIPAHPGVATKILETTVDGYAWIDTPAGGGASQLSDLSDVNTSTPTNRYVLVADGTDFESRLLVEADISDLGTYLTDITGESIGDLSDVDTTSIANEKMLQYNSTSSKWECVDAPSGGSGYTNLTSFVDQTAWRVFYSDTNGDVTELALGSDGTYLKSNGASAAPTWAVPSGSGDVSKVGTPVDDQVGVWTGDGTIEGDTALTFDTSTDVLSTGGLNLSGLTASEIVGTDASKNLVSLAVATYPSLTELSYVKGVTSAIQTQLGDKLEDITGESIGDLSDVDLTNIADTKILQYNAITSKWECETAPSGSGLSNVVEDTTPEAGGDFVMGDYNITGIGRASFTQELDNGSKSANFTIDFSTDQKQKVTLTANTMTLTLDTTSVGVANYLLKIVNGGLATLTWASESGSIYWVVGTEPTLTSSGTDIVTFYFDGTNWYGMAGLDFK